MWGTLDKDVSALAKALSDTGVALTSVLAEPRTNFTLPGTDLGPFFDGLARGVENARLLGAPRIVLGSGVGFPGAKRAQNLDRLVEVFSQAVEQTRGSGVKLILEPVNTRVDHPGALLDRTADAVAVARGVGSDSFGILYDLYHSVTEGEDPATELANAGDLLDYVQIADSPGRASRAAARSTGRPAWPCCGQRATTGRSGWSTSPPSSQPSRCRSSGQPPRQHEGAEMSTEPVEERLADLEQRLAAAELAATRAQDRGDVENVFSRYMHYHNAFEDERIIDELWVRRGTEGVRSQYNDDGVYTDWDTIMEYHRGRPHPVGKLILHYTTTPVIEVAADGSTAKGLWIMTGLESGLTDPAEAERIPPFFFAKQEVDGRRCGRTGSGASTASTSASRTASGASGNSAASRPPGRPTTRTGSRSRPTSGPSTRPSSCTSVTTASRCSCRPWKSPPSRRSQPYQIDTAQHLVPEPPQPYAEYEDTFR